MTHLLFTLIRTQFALPNPTSDYGQTVHAQSDNWVFINYIPGRPVWLV